MQWHCISSCLHLYLTFLSHLFLCLVELVAQYLLLGKNSIVAMPSHLHLEVCCCCTSLSLCVSSISITMAYYYAWLVAALWGFMLGVVIKKEMKTIYIVPQPEVYTCFTMPVCPSVYIITLLSFESWHTMMMLRLLPMIRWGLLLILGSKFKVILEFELCIILHLS